MMNTNFLLKTKLPLVSVVTCQLIHCTRVRSKDMMLTRKGVTSTRFTERSNKLNRFFVVIESCKKTPIRNAMIKRKEHLPLDKLILSSMLR